MTPLNSLHRALSRVKHASWSLLLFAFTAALPDLRAQTIPNPSFETNTFAVAGYISQNTPITGWTASAPNRIGQNPAGGVSPFADNGVIPNGTRVAFLQSTGGTSTLSTTITGLVVGTSYRVQFRANARKNNGFSDPPLPSYRINGGAPVSFSAPSVNDSGVFTNPYHTISGIFTATATTAALEISNTGTTDSTLLVDNFTIAAATAIQVTNANNDGPGSLRQVLAAAAATSAFNIITFAPALNGQTITLFSKITIQDAGGVVIDASALAAGLTLSGNNATAIFFIEPGSNVAMKCLTFTGGNGVHDNPAWTNGYGGAIANLASTLTLTRCTFSGNSAEYGGAVDNEGTMTAAECTFSGNSATTNGGAIITYDGLTTLTHCTISGNTAPADGGSGVASYGSLSFSETVVQNTIIAGNTNSDVDYVDLTENSFISNGHNLIGTGNATGAFNQTGDITGNTNPLLGPLASNGGPTQTMALLPGSPARNQAAVLVPAITTDQRGKAVQGVPDIGAYEVQKGTFVLSSAVYPVNESAGTKTVTIRRIEGFEGAASVKITSAIGTATAADFTAIPVGSQTINFPDNDNADKNLAIAINPDAVVETSESFSVALSLPSAGTALGTPATATVTIIDPPVLTFAGDNVAPTVTLTSPANGSTPGLNVGASLAISGSAADNKGVRKVQYSLNGDPFTDAILGTPGGTSTTWSASVVPISGSNTLSVRSVDFATGSGNATVTGSSIGSKTVTLLSVPLGLVPNSEFMGTKVASITGNTVTLRDNADATAAFVEVTSSATNSATVEVDGLEPGLAVGSTLLGRTVTNISGTTITLNGNANAAITTYTFVAFTPVVTVNSSSLATPTVVVASVPSILNVGSTLLGRSVTNIVSNTITLNGNANAATAAPTARPFGAAVPTPFTTTDRISTVVTNTFKVLRPLGVQIAGNGSVTPAGFSPTSFREAGQMVLLTAAAAAPGNIFKNWTIESGHTTGQLGIPLSALQKPTLNFIHREGLLLRANFVPNPYLLVRDGATFGLGTNSQGISNVEYNGLIHAYLYEPAPNGTRRSNSTEGLLTVTVTSTGAFSGKVTIDGSVLNLAGAFDHQGRARFGTSRSYTVTLARVNQPSLIVDDLSFDDIASDRSRDQINVAVLATSFQRSVLQAVSLGTADRAFYDGLTGPTTVPDAYLTVTGVAASPAGRSDAKYTVIFPAWPGMYQPPGFTTQDFPQGYGYGFITISKAGLVTLTSGKLADGTAISGSSKLSEDKEFPLFLQLYNKKGFLSGDVALDSTESDSDFFASNALAWLRPLDATQHYYPYGWDGYLDENGERIEEIIGVDLYGARYAATFTPASSVLRREISADALEPADPVNGNAGLLFYDGQLTEDLVRRLNISTTNVVTKVPASDTSFALTLTAATGLFTGTFVHENDDGVPVPPTTAYEGVIYQKGPGNGAYGFFLTRKPTPIDYTGESGAVELSGTNTDP